MSVIALRRFITPMAAMMALPVSLFAPSATAMGHPSYSAVTEVANLPESGPNGNPLDSGPPLLFGAGTLSVWANDNFTRTATVRLVGPTTDRNCSPSATTCYSWAGRLRDSGTFTTVPGQLALFGTSEVAEEQALTGAFNGGSPYFKFYASTNHADSALVPKTVNDPASGATVLWVEQFFPLGTVFSSGCGATGHSAACTPGSPIVCGTVNCPDFLGPWSWTYTLRFDTNAQCPNLAFRWVYNYIDRGTSPPDGSIQTPVDTGPTPCE